MRRAVAVAGTTDALTSKESVARECRRISDTRVLCVAMMKTFGTWLSVEHDTTARPVQDRTRALPSCDGAWRVSLIPLEGLATVTMST